MKSHLVVPRKVKYRIPFEPAFTPECIYPKYLKTGTQADTWMLMFTHTTLFLVAKRQKQPKCPTDEWMNKMWSIHMMEYQLAVKGMKFLTHAATQMNPETIMISEKSQSQKRTNTV